MTDCTPFLDRFALARSAMVDKAEECECTRYDLSLPSEGTTVCDGLLRDYYSAWVIYVDECSLVEGPTADPEAPQDSDLCVMEWMDQFINWVQEHTCPGAEPECVVELPFMRPEDRDGFYGLIPNPLDIHEIGSSSGYTAKVIKWFDSGTIFPPGEYRVNYLSGMYFIQTNDGMYLRCNVGMSDQYVRVFVRLLIKDCHGYYETRVIHPEAPRTSPGGFDFGYIADHANDPGGKYSQSGFNDTDYLCPTRGAQNVQDRAVGEGRTFALNRPAQLGVVVLQRPEYVRQTFVNSGAVWGDNTVSNPRYGLTPCPVDECDCLSVVDAGYDQIGEFFWTRQSSCACNYKIYVHKVDGSENKTCSDYAGETLCGESIFTEDDVFATIPHPIDADASNVHMTYQHEVGAFEDNAVFCARVDVEHEKTTGSQICEGEPFCFSTTCTPFGQVGVRGDRLVDIERDIYAFTLCGRTLVAGGSAETAELKFQSRYASRIELHVTNPNGSVPILRETIDDDPTLDWHEKSFYYTFPFPSQGLFCFPYTITARGKCGGVAVETCWFGICYNTNAGSVPSSVCEAAYSAAGGLGGNTKVFSVPSEYTQNGGQLIVYFDFRGAPDRLKITSVNTGGVLFDTGCRGGTNQPSGSIVNVPAGTTRVAVALLADCQNRGSTSWTFSIDCLDFP